MNLQGGESNSNQPPAATPVTTEPGLEGVVAAAQEAAAQPTTPVQAAETPEGQFVNQFGSGVTQPVVETPSSIMPNTDSNTPPAVDMSVPQPSTDNLVPEQTQPVVEVLAQPEEDPQATFVQDVKDAVKKLEEAQAKNKIASS